MRSATDPDEVLVSLQWIPPAPRNGPYELELNYTAVQHPPYPAARAMNDSGTATLPQHTSNFTVGEALPFANYSISLRAINIKLRLKGVASNTDIRSLATGESVNLLNHLDEVL